MRNNKISQIFFAGCILSAVNLAYAGSACNQYLVTVENQTGKELGVEYINTDGTQTAALDLKQNNKIDFFETPPEVTVKIYERLESRAWGNILYQGTLRKQYCGKKPSDGSFSLKSDPTSIYKAISEGIATNCVDNGSPKLPGYECNPNARGSYKIIIHP
ncbi:hypothetical protein BH10PSE19_BH10PSE19_12320 [soil metagenome]